MQNLCTMPSDGPFIWLSPKTTDSPKLDEFYSMPQRVGHAILGNLEVLHQKANGSTIVFTHCEQDNEIK